LRRYKDGPIEVGQNKSEAPEILSVDLKHSTENFRSHRIFPAFFVHFCNTLFHFFPFSSSFCSYHPFNQQELHCPNELKIIIYHIEIISIFDKDSLFSKTALLLLSVNLFALPSKKQAKGKKPFKIAKFHSFPCALNCQRTRVNTKTTRTYTIILGIFFAVSRIFFTRQILIKGGLL
jgi:hypothetical protein